jgi:hypothetical protein
MEDAMTGLGREAMALIAEARDGDDPTLADRDRVEAVIAARLATGAAAGLAAAAVATTSARASGAPGAVGASALTGSVAKVLIWVATLSVIGATVAMFASAPGRATAPIASTVNPAAPVATEGNSQSGEPSLGAAVATPEATIPQVRAFPSTLAVVPTASSTRMPSGDVAAEVLVLREAHAAMRGGQAARALALLDEHARRFPKGALGEERDAARVAALCALGRVAEARAAADRFLRASPVSPHAGRVRASCGGSPAAPASSF